MGAAAELPDGVTKMSRGAATFRLAMAARSTLGLAAAGTLALAGCGGAATATQGAVPGSSGAQPSAAATIPSAAPTARTAGHAGAAPVRPTRHHRHERTAAPPPSYAVGERIMTFVDRSRTVRFPGQSPEPRTLVTLVRYPAAGPTSATDVRDAPALHSAGPFPLIVFGHGFAVTPAPYARLLQAWAQAGYVVAAPIFPLENANAPGGPDESDLVHQPRDMRFVISRMLAASADPSSPLAGLVTTRQIAVSGQSDGGETALAVGYDRYYRDRRVRAAVILSGAVIPGVGGFDFPARSPPLLATQGTADSINPPHFTHQFFGLAPRPKYLLELLGAGHLPPYTYQRPQLTIVERVTVAFLDHYLKGGAANGVGRIRAAGRVPGLARLFARP